MIASLENLEAEELVASSVLIDVRGETLDAIEADALPLEAFTRYDIRTVIAIARRLHASGKPSDLQAIALALNGSPDIEAVGGMAGLAAMVSKNPTTAHIREAIAALKELHAKRQIAAFTKSIGELAGCADVSAEHLRNRLNVFIERIAESSSTDELLRRMELKRRNHAEPPIRAPAVFTLAGGVPVATAGNLTTILAQAKSGKTAFVGALVGSAIARDAGTTGGDFLTAEAGIRPDGAVTLLIDTEQDPYDHHQVLLRAARRARMDDVPDWVEAFSLVGTTPTDLRTMLRLKLAALRKSGTPVWFAVIDGVADLLNDPNSLEEAQAVVTELLDHAAVNACPIICIMHRNEGRMADDTARGHIGKQLARKSAFNLVLEKDEAEVTTVYATQNRGAPILKATGPRFAFNAEAGMHISVETAAKSKDDAKAEELREILSGVMQAGSTATYSAIKNGIVSTRGCAGRTAERHISLARKLEVLKFAGGDKLMLAAA